MARFNRTDHTCKKVLDLRVNSMATDVWRLPVCRSPQNEGCAVQTNPTPDLTLSLTLTLTPTLWGALGLLSRSAGAVLSLRADLKTLHVVQLNAWCLTASIHILIHPYFNPYFEIWSYFICFPWLTFSQHVCVCVLHIKPFFYSSTRCCLVLANSRFRAFRKSICAQEKAPTNLYE